MAMLEALAAFALAMVAFSTMVSAIVEMIHRFVNLRQKGFERMLERLYVDVIKPRVGDALKPDAKDFVAHVAHIRGLPTRPTIQEAVEKKSVVKMIKALWTPIGAWFVPHTENKITPIQLIERLAETDVGKAIAAQGRDRMVAVVEDIALQFERLGDSTRDYFAQRAYALSIIVSVLLALAANIDAGRLFSGFLENPESRAKLLAASDSITAAYETQAQSLAKTQAEKKTPEGEAAAAADKLAEDTKKKAADIRAEIVKLSGLGLAIGHDYYPWCETRELTIDAEIKIARLEGRLLREPSAKYGAALPPIATPVRDARCRPYFDKLKVCYAEVERQDQSDCLMRAQDSYLPSGAAAAPGALIPWAFFCIVAGLMIGLGGPFWFNAFTSLSRVLQVARAVREVVQGAKPADDQQKGAATSEGAQRPTTPTEAFDRVIAASLPASVPGNPFAPAVRRGDRPI